MTTALDLISSALLQINVIGANATPNDNQSSDGLKSLNRFMDRLSNKKLMIYNQVNEIFTLVPTQASYTIGPGGDFDTIRPLKIINAEIRLGGTDDYPIAMVNNQEYQSMFSKTIESDIPRALYYQTTHPLGKIFIYPAPSSNLELRITSSKLFEHFATINTDVILPVGYEDMIIYNLAVRYSIEYEVGNKINPLIIKEAKDSMRDIKRTNLKRPSRFRYQRIVNGSGSYDSRSNEVF